MYQKLLPAQNHSFFLGLALKLERHEVESIHDKYLDHCDRLWHVIVAFLKQEVKELPSTGVAKICICRCSFSACLAIKRANLSRDTGLVRAAGRESFAPHHG